MFKLTFATCCRHLGFSKITNTRTSIRTILLREIQRFRPGIDKIQLQNRSFCFIADHRPRSSRVRFEIITWRTYCLVIGQLNWQLIILSSFRSSWFSFLAHLLTMFFYLSKFFRSQFQGESTFHSVDNKNSHLLYSFFQRIVRYWNCLLPETRAKLF